MVAPEESKADKGGTLDTLPDCREFRITRHPDLRGEQKEGQQKALEALCTEPGEFGFFSYMQ